MNRTSSSKVCDICGSPRARDRRISRTYGNGATLLVIENIPVVHCSNCGETYMDPDTVRAIERIKRHRKRLAKQRPVPIASLE
jgi:YgiT-type zinc finger domain-containing protein